MRRMQSRARRREGCACGLARAGGVDYSWWRLSVENVRAKRQSSSCARGINGWNHVPASAPWSTMCIPFFGCRRRECADAVSSPLRPAHGRVTSSRLRRKRRSSGRRRAVAMRRREHARPPATAAGSQRTPCCRSSTNGSSTASNERRNRESALPDRHRPPSSSRPARRQGRAWRPPALRRSNPGDPHKRQTRVAWTLLDFTPCRRFLPAGGLGSRRRNGEIVLEGEHPLHHLMRLVHAHFHHLLALLWIAARVAALHTRRPAHQLHVIAHIGIEL